MLRITQKFLVFALITYLFAACNSENTQTPSGKNEQLSSQFFLIGKGPYLKKTTCDIIEKSGIRKGGHVIILSMAENKLDSSAFFLQKQFGEQEIMAVHIFDFADRIQKKPSPISLTNSEILAIENASIICIPDGNRNSFMKLANNTRLKKVLQNAKAKGVLIVGIGSGASVLGDHYYAYVNDTVLKRYKIIMKPGLDLLKNTVIDNIVFIRNYKEAIQKNSKNKNFVFVGLADTSCLWIKESNARVLRKSKIVFIFPNKPMKKLVKGDELIGVF